MYHFFAFHTKQNNSVYKLEDELNLRQEKTQKELSSRDDRIEKSKGLY